MTVLPGASRVVEKSEAVKVEKDVKEAPQGDVEGDNGSYTPSKINIRLETLASGGVGYGSRIVEDSQEYVRFEPPVP
eukprot:CAMPEP_0113966720 /NCGR_PEP_ID=MMETSP0011_2-20120614/8478_1 /TAXON_ID=101924 /ORGANISM="Rhodosorus marinus" /LENGTH=76 /DNA_ID=CAMNT_0000979417 /DNA_START=170 /DNA_END=400 /DNA_ORIENTATION=+ /assembly_acc=CAM_ASM_000156